MHAPTFRRALLASWDLVRHKKSLWIFGLLSAVLGNWGISEFLGRMNFAFHGEKAYDFTSWFSGLYFEGNWNNITAVLLSIWLVGILVALGLVAVFIAVSSRGAIMAYAVHWYKKEAVIPLAEAWHTGVRHFWQILAFSVFGKILQSAVIMCSACLFIWLRMQYGFAWSLAQVGVLLFALILVLVIEATSIYSAGYAMIRRRNFFKSLKDGFNLFREHKLVSLELGIVLALCSLLLVGAIIFVSYIALAVSVLIWIAAGFSSSNFLFGLGMVVGAILLTLLVIICAGIFNAFNTCSWMYLFMKMHHEGVLSRTLHYVGKLFRR
jgi:hypothetical protein